MRLGAKKGGGMGVYCVRRADGGRSGRWRAACANMRLGAKKGGGMDAYRVRRADGGEWSPAFSWAAAGAFDRHKSADIVLFGRWFGRCWRGCRRWRRGTVRSKPHSKSLIILRGGNFFATLAHCSSVGSTLKKSCFVSTSVWVFQRY